MTDVVLDTDQTIVAGQLALLAQRLSQTSPLRKWQWWRRDKPANNVRGCYIWGSVGRGKTLLMDRFFSHLKTRQKRRVHFHHFMRDVHQLLNQYKQQQNPLRQIAKNLGRKAKVICLDEFMVDDIADAMILGELLKNLFALDVVLVTTSNTPPDRLYWNGLQRAQFLPAIDAIKNNMTVLELAGNHDYRLQWLESTHAYHTPSDTKAENALNSFFDNFSDDHSHNVTIELNHRPLKAIRHHACNIWASFDELCVKPRAPEDYIDLASEYATVLISEVPIMNTDQDDAARRFVNLIDTLYDHRCRLVIAAEAAAPQLYVGDRLQDDFQRTASRLQEMTTSVYWQQQHLSGRSQ